MENSSKLIRSITTLLGYGLLCLAMSQNVWAEKKNRALLIGINQYETPELKLYGTHNDVAAFRTMLTVHLGFQDNQILEIKDQKATRQNILDAIDQWLIQGSKPGDRLVLYYSGHGDQIEDQNGDEWDDHMDEALIAYDSTSDGRNWVLDDDIDQRLQKLRDREVLAVFDSCHSGTLTRGLTPDDGAKTPGWRVSKNPALKSAPTKNTFIHQAEGNLAAFFAVSPDQIALEDKSKPERAHGVFTAAFVEGLQGGADANHDGKISYAELFRYLGERSQAYCEDQKKQHKCARGLTPVKQYEEARAETILAQNNLPSRFIFVPNTPPSMPASSTPQPPPAKAPKLTAKPKPDSHKPVKPAEVFQHGNEARLKLQIQPGTSLHLGQSVHYEVEVPRSGKLVLFDYDAAGNATLLYPNHAIPDSAPPPCGKLPDVLPAGTKIRMPDNCMGFEFTVEEPTGTGTIVAVLVEDAGVVKDENLMPSTRGLERFSIPPDPAGWMNKLREMLDQAFPGENGKNREVKWSVITANYEITP
jgi:hypothetical protein